MLKSNHVLEIKRQERLFQFLMPTDASLGEIHDVLHEMKLFIVKTLTERAQTEVKSPDQPPEPQEAA